MFFEWMKCNVVDQQARELTYVKFPTKFIWDKENWIWRMRKNNNGAIGRIHHVAPVSGDLFYLRILLIMVKGPTSYEEIRKVNGKVFDNFKDAYYELRLLDDDIEYIDSIKEAFFGEGGHFIKKLFAQLLLSNIMSRLEVVFDKTFKFLYVDVVHPHRPGTQIQIELLKGLTLQEIKKLLQRNSSSLRTLLLSGGQTAHSRFRIPLNPIDESFCTISPDSKLAELIRRAKLIIWDEAPMVNKICVKLIDPSMRDICRQVNPNSKDTLFGGKIVVFGGDFRQILHVIQKGKRENIVAASVNSSYLWDYVTV
ncbi:uncharacterized protein [Rutidosis leptorrhynchoides]|uniref:uncharacterized protein n=1 Tax=Rutidosis leptorrhynchoides TaxID=125765 RepID=UPI003A99EC82